MANDIPLYDFIANVIGIAGSITSIVLFFFIAITDISLLNRLSLRLQVLISFVNLASHIHSFFTESHTSDDSCAFIGLIGNYLQIIYITITFINTLNLHLNILTKRLSINYEKYFWLTIVLVPLFFTTPIYALNGYGKDNHDYCFINMNLPYSHVIIYTHVIIPATVIFIYSSVITVIVYFKAKNIDLLDKILGVHDVYDKDSKVLFKKLLSNWIRRLILFPVSFCLIFSGLLVDFFVQIMFKKKYTFLYYWASTGFYLSGFINLITLINDPYFMSAIWITFSNPDKEERLVKSHITEKGDLLRKEVDLQVIDKEISKITHTRIIETYNSLTRSEAETFLRNKFKSF